MGARHRRHWKDLAYEVERRLRPSGLDIVAPLSLSWYNEAVPEHLHLPAFKGCSDPLILLIGNSRAIWDPFVENLRQNGKVPKDPVNCYVRDQVLSATRDLPPLNAEQEEDEALKELELSFYWSQDCEPGKLIAIQRMAHIAGIAFLDEVTHLCIHPEYGPWVSLRAAVVINVPGPPEKPLEPRNPMDQQTVERIAELSRKAMAAEYRPGRIDPVALSDSMKGMLQRWQLWIAARVGIAPGHPAMYCDNQILYHYCNHDGSTIDILEELVAKPYLPPTISLLQHPGKEVIRTRETMLSVLRRLAKKAEGRRTALLLSGGLDTSIVAEAKEDPYADGPRMVNFEEFFTVRAHVSGTDEPYACRIAERLKTKHTVISISIEELISSSLQLLISALVSFDPMELRNSLVVARSMQEAASKGYECIFTGDAADELFGGYSFTQGLSEEKFKSYQLHLSRIMQFSAPRIGEKLGLEVLCPFKEPEMIDLALALEKEHLVGKRFPIDDGRTHGKLILRLAFPEASSQWRGKDPMEVGAGTTELRNGYFENWMEEREFKERQREIMKEQSVYMRDKEHLFFFQEFLKTFGALDKVPRGRTGQDPCPGCGFDLSSPEQDFCTLCGHYPAKVTEKSSEYAREQFRTFLEEKQVLLEEVGEGKVTL